MLKKHGVKLLLKIIVSLNERIGKKKENNTEYIKRNFAGEKFQTLSN